jgi:hypothetical protein
MASTAKVLRTIRCKEAHPDVTKSMELKARATNSAAAEEHDPEKMWY